MCLITSLPELPSAARPSCSRAELPQEKLRDDVVSFQDEKGSLGSC